MAAIAASKPAPARTEPSRSRLHAGSNRHSWFALPGSAVLLFEWLRRRSLPPPTAQALAPAAAYVALLSLMSRRAVRYVFPAYALCNLAGAQLLINRSQSLHGWIRTRTQWLEPALATFVVVAAAARVALR